jgi:hypothetical protein
VTSAHSSRAVIDDFLGATGQKLLQRFLTSSKRKQAKE